MHLIDKHQYPKNFFFAVTKDGIDGRRSLLVDGHHRRRSSNNFGASKQSRRRASLVQGDGSPAGDEHKDKAAPVVAPKVESDSEEESEASADTDMDDLAGAMSSLQFVPPSVRFGRGGRSGFSRS